MRGQLIVLVLGLLFGCGRNGGEEEDADAGDNPDVVPDDAAVEGDRPDNADVEADPDGDGEACVAESPAETCGGWVCGTRTNSCGEPVSCGDCPGGETCRDGVCIGPFPVDLLFEDVDPFAAGEVVPATAGTLQDAVAAVLPGQAVVLEDGTYEGLQLDIAASGTADQPVIVRPESPGGVILRNGSRLVISGSYLIVAGFVFDRLDSEGNVVRFSGARYARLTQCVFFQCGHRDPLYHKVVLFRDSSQHNRLDHSLIKCTLGQSVGVQVTDGGDPIPPGDLEILDCRLGTGVTVAGFDVENTWNVIDHNAFKDIPATRAIPGSPYYGQSSYNEGEPIQLGYGAEYLSPCPTHATVAYNLFDSASGDDEMISDKSSEALILYNTFRFSNADQATYPVSGLSIRRGRGTRVEGNYFLDGSDLSIHGEENVVVNNYFSGSGWAAVSVWPGSHDFGEESTAAGYSSETARNNLIAHNTIVDFTDRGLYVGRDCTSAELPIEPELNVYADNIVTTDASGARAVYHLCGHDETWIQNLLWSADGTSYGNWDEGVVRADPQLEPATVGWATLLRLTGASPAVDAASPLTDPMIRDIFGNARDDAPDIGAEEFGPTATPSVPLSTADVLPGWMTAYVESNCSL